MKQQPNNLDWFLELKEDGLFYVGHASALARINGQLVAFDPVWNHKPYGDYWYFSPSQINCDKVHGKIAGSVVSHIHEDHISERCLKICDAPILIMEGRKPLCDRLKRSQTRNVTEFEPWKWHKVYLGPEAAHNDKPLEFFFVPHPFNTVDSSCFVRNPETGYCVYHGNDNFLSQETLCKLRDHIGPIDVAMVPYAFIHWYPFLMEISHEEKLAEIKRLNQQSMDQAYMFCEILHPKHVVPFGNNLVHVENQFLNQHTVRMQDFVGALQLQAGGFIIGEDVFYCDPPEENFLYTLVDKCKRAETTVPKNMIMVNSENWEPGNTYCIDLEARTAWQHGSGMNPRPDFNCHHFTFKPLVHRKWLLGEITFEQALGTRQFTCERTPNVYNLAVFEWMNRWL